MRELKGTIYQSVSGFYYVWAEGKQYATKPKGLFRHKNEKPLVGDQVIIQVDDTDSQSESRLSQILQRRNALVRPSVANVDYAVVVTSLVEPVFSYNLLDFFLVQVESKGIQPIIALSKYDLLVEALGTPASEDKVKEIQAVYEKAGYEVLCLQHDASDIKLMQEVVKEGLYVVMGQSGVGKSTLLNQLLPQAAIETAEISDALNRGRHTTREVTLYPFNNGFIADTPGFSAIEFPDIEKEDLRFLFPEIARSGEGCKFRSCLHINEPGCQVQAAVASGEIASSRYTNYVTILDRIENRKPVYRKKK